jgi:hypothetical protein
VGAEADDDGLPVSLEGLPAAHLQVLLDGLPVFERYGLLLAGGYAFRAHEILRRPSQDLDFATRDDTPLPEIAGHVRNAFQAAGYRVELVEATGRYARSIGSNVSPRRRLVRGSQVSGLLAREASTRSRNPSTASHSSFSG